MEWLIFNIQLKDRGIFVRSYKSQIIITQLHIFKEIFHTQLFAFIKCFYKTYSTDQSNLGTIFGLLRLKYHSVVVANIIHLCCAMHM